MDLQNIKWGLEALMPPVNRDWDAKADEPCRAIISILADMLTVLGNGGEGADEIQGYTVILKGLLERLHVASRTPSLRPHDRERHRQREQQGQGLQQ
jgi:hypothetical protein